MRKDVILTRKNNYYYLEESTFTYTINLNHSIYTLYFKSLSKLNSYTNKINNCTNLKKLYTYANKTGDLYFTIYLKQSGKTYKYSDLKMLTFCINQSIEVGDLDD